LTQLKRTSWLCCRFLTSTVGLAWCTSAKFDSLIFPEPSGLGLGHRTPLICQVSPAVEWRSWQESRKSKQENRSVWYRHNWPLPAKCQPIYDRRESDSCVKQLAISDPEQDKRNLPKHNQSNLTKNPSHPKLTGRMQKSTQTATDTSSEAEGEDQVKICFFHKLIFQND